MVMQPVVVAQVVPPGPEVGCDFDPEAFRPSGGVGGWSTHQRPRRTPLVEWDATPALQLTVDLVFNGLGADASGDESREQALRTLEAFGRPVAGSDLPPTVAVRGGWEHAHRWWIIDELARGDDQVRLPSGDRIRQTVTLSLVEVTRIGNPGPSAKVRRRIARRRPARRLVAAFGDTPWTLAWRALGDTSRWVDIVEANDDLAIRDADDDLAGVAVRIPGR